MFDIFYALLSCVYASLSQMFIMCIVQFMMIGIKAENIRSFQNIAQSVPNLGRYEPSNCSGWHKLEAANSTILRKNGIKYSNLL